MAPAEGVVTQDVQIDGRILDILVARVSRVEEPSTRMKPTAYLKWVKERNWIIREFDKLRKEKPFWSVSEYEFFVKKILDHLGAP